jgi:hypothetical protein
MKPPRYRLDRQPNPIEFAVSATIGGLLLIAVAVQKIWTWTH